MPTEKFSFPGHSGHDLAARLDRPEVGHLATAVFAHCFTCGKDIAASRRISARLCAMGIAVLRFDFTGLGHSGGEFANTHFSSNVEDLLRAAKALSDKNHAPDLLIGHSLGGAAVLKAAGEIDSVKAVVTIAAPADPGHVAHLFEDQRETLEAEGEAELTIAGRSIRIGRQFLEDIAEAELTPAIARMKKALLILHAPRDEVVGIDNATRIFTAARHPKSFVTLDGADHLLSRRGEADYAADVIAAWASRYIRIDVPAAPASAPRATRARAPAWRSRARP